MQKITDGNMIKEQYEQYLTDESRLNGKAVTTLYFPESCDDVITAVGEIGARGEHVTVSSGRTGIVGGAVPCGTNNLMSLEKLSGDIAIGYDTDWFVRVPASMTLQDLTAYLHKGEYTFLPGTVLSASIPQKLFYPINPTEATAQIGGTVATNASGSRSFFYGATRTWVRRMRVVLANGGVLNLTRGTNRAHNGILSLDEGIRVPVCDSTMPRVKNTAGLYLTHDVDAIDLFIGSEGTLGIITDVDLVLIPQPAHILGQILFFRDKRALIAFLMTIRQDERVKPIAMEYFDNHSLNLLRAKRKEEGASSTVAPIPDTVQYALYVENMFAADDELDILFNTYEQVLKKVGASADDSWAGFDEKTLEQMTQFRHAVPEAINTIIGLRKIAAPAIRKVSSDMAVPPEKIEHILTVYEALLNTSHLEYAIFGHIGDGHVHVNIIPKNASDVEKGYRLFTVFAHEVVACGGSVAAEHGIGRLKKELLTIQYSPETIEGMKKIKRVLDERCMLSPGVLFDM